MSVEAGEFHIARLALSSRTDMCHWMVRMDAARVLLIMQRSYRRKSTRWQAHTNKAQANTPLVNHRERKVAAYTAILPRRPHAALLISGDDGFIACCTATPATIDRVHGITIPVTLRIRLCAGSHNTSNVYAAPHLPAGQHQC